MDTTGLGSTVISEVASLHGVLISLMLGTLGSIWYSKYSTWDTVSIREVSILHRAAPQCTEFTESVSLQYYTYKEVTSSTNQSSIDNNFCYNIST